MLPLQREDGYTWADYISWDENLRIELIDGVPYHYGVPLTGQPMDHASPTTSHQDAVLGLAMQFRQLLKGKPCKVYVAPLSVRLHPSGNNGDNDALEPDLFVVCDPAKMQKNGCYGAPDLVAEVLSPSTTKTDRVVKFRKYLLAGVREYWLVDPDSQTVQVNRLHGGMYVAEAYQSPEQVPVEILGGNAVDLGQVFSSEEE